MKRRLLLCAAALSLLASGPVLAAPLSGPELAAAVRERLQQPAVLRGDFEQSKQVQGFAKPLLSRGDFIVARERGVLWRTKTPFASNLRLTRDEIVATQGNGAVAFRLDAGKEPSVRIINGLMFSLLNGDIAALSEYFRIEGQIDGRRWQLQLQPRQAALSKLFKAIELNGDSHVTSIRLDEANGDLTQLRFSAQRSEPARLSADEAARFD
ncbi:outer membrane lipoprotein carrier protein LolA [Paucibacter sp. Y2R2-4]|uniref:outer membrane lipoprotein carrier protein LolA n=1 Tax=Paucibacter sp. Y2R2-4 TaxID=2893553 RepID=UPI0021E3CC85|nr:outer membrane lipoprotein carrier protein LolA [Paucibacter sp. Y2R2-4]MCV2350881.1 outer membrane lipoprotein carrier protein LolA [Paucibacter sp. Y2R2-4]